MPLFQQSDGGCMPTQAEKVETYRALHARPGAFALPNPWDVGTAVLLAKLGFEALATTSAGYAFSIGKRDNAVGREPMLAHVAAIVAATPSAGERRSRERLRRRPEDGRRDHAARRRDRHRRRLDRGRDRACRRSDLRARLRGRAGAGGRGGRARAQGALRADGACRELHRRAVRISATRSRVCRRTRRRAPTCCTRRA